MNRTVVIHWLNEQHIRYSISKAHAGLAEITSRTTKAMIYGRIESAKARDNEDKRWVDVLFAVLLKYNHVDKHHTFKITPDDARQPRNQLKVKNT